MRYFGLLLLMMTCGSCAMAPRATPVAARLPEQRGPVITRIVSRDTTVVVRAGVDGADATYSVESKSGEILVPDMTLPQLARANPELFRSVQTAQSSVMYAGLGD